MTPCPPHCRQGTRPVAPAAVGSLDMSGGISSLVGQGTLDGAGNLGNPTEGTIAEIAQRIGALTGSRSEILTATH